MWYKPFFDDDMDDSHYVRNTRKLATDNFVQHNKQERFLQRVAIAITTHRYTSPHALPDNFFRTVVRRHYRYHQRSSKAPMSAL
ncbi:hypothetical protein ACMAZF_01425 [Psychrobium sp. nBUS_13]|uniref:hypothetical protein n=1 Tax=Psychrobium sp. nBUS_13 TaxID=3395319 RepID=UPI003EBE107D